MEPEPTGRSSRDFLLKLALGVCIALLLVPATRLLLLSHLRTEFLPSRSQNDPQLLHAAASQRLDDFEFQLADALNPTEEPDKPLSISKRERLQELAKRFPDQPPVYANMLRFMTQGEVMTRRKEPFLLTGEPVPQFLNVAPSESNPEVLATFEDAAERGERLDPTNAYFPLMHAVGLFAEHRDDEALGEMHHAAQSARWDDYCQDEVTVDKKLYDAAYGRQPALRHLLQAAAILFPHYSQVRSAAGITAYKAVQAETDGRFEEGFAIREDILRIGRLIRTQSAWAIGCNFGIGITDIAMTRPGGASLAKEGSNRQYNALLEPHANACAAYFRSIGHGDAADWLKSEVEKSKQETEIIASGAKKSLFDYFNWDVMCFIPLWLLCSILPLANIVTVLALGGTGYLLLWMRARKVSLWQRGVCFTALVSLLGFWQCRVVEAAISPWYILCRDLGVKELPEIVSNPFWFNLSCFAVPILMLVGLTLFGLFSRVPLHLALARGMRHLAVPTTCVLVLGYGGMLVCGAYEDNRLNYALGRISAHEGYYLAELVGKEWPETVGQRTLR